MSGHADTIRDALEQMLIIGRVLGVEKHGTEIESALAALDALEAELARKDEALRLAGEVLETTGDYLVSVADEIAAIRPQVAARLRELEVEIVALAESTGKPE